MPSIGNNSQGSPRFSVAESAAATASLSKLVYRSRAVAPLSAPELLQLTNAAQARNRREAITGLMLYDNNRFFQWLEGPADGVARVMGSIRHDPRHTEIEVLTEQRATGRAFGDWAMKLSTNGQVAATMPGDVLEPPAEIVETLREQPEAAPTLLVKLVPMATTPDPVTAEALARVPLTERTASILRTVLLSAVIPTLADQQKAASLDVRPWNTHPRVRELADLLVGTDHDAAISLIEELHRDAGTAPVLFASVFEPAARFLGDLWTEDECSELDVTIGLSRLQTAVRLLTGHTLPVYHHAPPPVVLIAPEPGEMHRLGAAMDSEVLFQAGWMPQTEYPTNDKALQDLLAGSWFDVLDLSLSGAFRRDHWLPRVTKTITQARQASRNPALVVVVGGRVFVEERGACAQVGADFSNRTAHHVDQSILQTIRATRN